VKSGPSSVSTGIFAGQVSLSQRLPPTSGGASPTKIIFPNYVNIKSMAGRFALALNRQGVDAGPILDDRANRNEDVESRAFRFEDLCKGFAGPFRTASKFRRPRAFAGSVESPMVV
jgi:hypothetical protein